MTAPPVAIRILEGDCRDVLTTLPSESVHCVVTSPPYYGLRNYGVAGQLGLESTPAEYIASMVDVFREVRRVLRKDGTLWLNLGDSYASHDPGGYRTGEFLNPNGRPPVKQGAARNRAGNYRPGGLKPKDLIGIPWMLAFALRDDGWYLRSDIIWSKPNPMPESVTDRPTKAHEYLFLLTKSARYYYDADAIREDAVCTLRPETSARHAATKASIGSQYGGIESSGLGWNRPELGRNKRSVWEIATNPFPEAHFATYPTALVEPCIKAGSPVGGTVLDPFIGAGTTLLVADRLQREAIGIELNPTYAAMARRRVVNDAPMFVEIAV